MHHARSFAALVPALILALALPAAAQRGAPAGAPPEYDAALARLAAGDTTGAVVGLRAAIRRAAGFGPAHLRLGALLSARAGDAEASFRDRREAERALRTAIRLMPDDAAALLEYGLLLRRQQSRVDAKRTLERAWQLAERQSGALEPELRARFHYELARIYETWWEDWQNLVMIPETVERVACGRAPGPLTHADAAVACPEEWARQSDHVVPLADLKSEERQRMLGHLRAAVVADPALEDAALRLLGHLADDRDWDEFDRVLRHLLLAAPDDPRAHLFAGLSLHERGRLREAEAAFTRALALLPDEDRAVFADVSLLLTPDVRERYRGLDEEDRAEAARIVFAAKTPLFLTGVEERRLEHYARLAWTELKFASPTAGERGWDSDRGRIWVRYGAPWRWYQCCYGTALPVRHAYWSYGEAGPVFVFSRNRTYRRARMSELAVRLERQLEADTPEMYRPRTIPALMELPHQVARFRGEDPSLTRVELYAGVALAELAASPGDRVEAAFFIFDPAYRPVWGEPARVEAAEETLGLTYRLEVVPGDYVFSLEARRVDADTVPRPAARSREALEVRPFPPESLAVSDLLLASAIESRGPVERRTDLRIVPLRTTELRAGDPILLYFEIYGLADDGDGLARYRAALVMEDATRRNLAQRVLRGVQELVRGTQTPELRWERTAPVRDGVTVDYLRIEAEALVPGTYTIRIRIDAPGAGAAETTRRVRVLD
jgi:GWxTD domain-containing protein